MTALHLGSESSESERVERDSLTLTHGALSHPVCVGEVPSDGQPLTRKAF